MKRQYLIAAEWKLSVRATLIIAKFHFERIRAKQFHYGPNLTCVQMALWQLHSERHDVEQ